MHDPLGNHDTLVIHLGSARRVLAVLSVVDDIAEHLPGEVDLLVRESQRHIAKLSRHVRSILTVPDNFDDFIPKNEESPSDGSLGGLIKGKLSWLKSAGSNALRFKEIMDNLRIAQYKNVIDTHGCGASIAVARLVQGEQSVGFAENILQSPKGAMMYHIPCNTQEATTFQEHIRLLPARALDYEDRLVKGAAGYGLFPAEAPANNQPICCLADTAHSLEELTSSPPLQPYRDRITALSLYEDESYDVEERAVSAAFARALSASSSAKVVIAPADSVALDLAIISGADVFFVAVDDSSARDEESLRNAPMKPLIRSRHDQRIAPLDAQVLSERIDEQHTPAEATAAEETEDVKVANHDQPHPTLKLKS